MDVGQRDKKFKDERLHVDQKVNAPRRVGYGHR
jgi:hypothetical protein